MRTVALIALVTATAVPFLALAGSASGHRSNYAFEARDVKIKQNNLRWVFNRTFPDWAPHQVACRGQGRTTMRGGGIGYVHIRCEIISMNVPDFIWHLNARGEEFTTRSW